MHISQNEPLAQHSTMRLGGTAQYFCSVTSEDDLLETLTFAGKNHLSVRTIGSGSNIVWRDEGYVGLLIEMAIEGVVIEGTTVRIGAGHNWDDAVLQTVEAGLSGIELLSLIPGTAGATPIQNVGAYGTDISKVLQDVRAYDLHTNQFVSIPAHECGFGYRSSRFKHGADAGRFVITEITLQLYKEHLSPPFYESLGRYIADNHITDYSPFSLRQAVIAVRSSKLPDPARVANNGSFFANPIVSAEKYASLSSQYPDLVAWPMPDTNYKLSAGWLMEKAGFKDYHNPVTGIGTWKHHALVLVNESARSSSQLMQEIEHINQTIESCFGLHLEPEPEILP